MQIVSLAPSNTEILFALGLDEEIVGVTRFCDYPPKAAEKPIVGGWLDVDDNLVKSLKPDLILTSTFLQKEIALRYKKMGFKVVHLDPVSLVGVMNSILNIGKAVERFGEAQRLVKEMGSKIDEIKDNSNRKFKPNVYAEEWHNPMYVCGNWIPKLVEIAGGISGLIKEGERSRIVTLKEISDYNPDIIVLTWCSFKNKSQIGWVKSRKGWENIFAVKSNRIYSFDDSLLNRPGPRLVDGLEELQRTINGNLLQ